MARDLTDDERAVLAAVQSVGPDIFEQAKQEAVINLYVSMVELLLGEPDANAAHYVRGIARIGIDTEPEDEFGKDTHRRVMTTLERVGLEPFSSEEVEAEMRNAAVSLMSAKGDAPPPS